MHMSKSFRNLRRLLLNYLPSESALGTSDLAVVKGRSLCLVNQGWQVGFPASPSLSDETLSCGPVF